MNAKTLTSARWLAAAAAVVAVTAAPAAAVHQAPGTRPSASAPSAASAPAVQRSAVQGAVSQASSQPVGSLEDEPIGGRQAGGRGGRLGDWLQPLAALAVVIVLIFLLRVVLKRLGRRGRVRAGGDVVEVLHRTHLAGRCEVCLIRLGRRVLLIGLGPSGPVTLCDIRDEQEAQALLAGLARPSGPDSTSGAVREVAERIRSRLSGDTKVQD